MSEPATNLPPNDFSDLPVGEILRRTRVHYNRSVEDVEAALRIQAKQIHAIEVGDTEALPARVYAIGFVRSYAEYLGLDGEKIVTLFKTQTGEPAQEQDLSKVPQSITESQTPPVGIVVGMLALICVVMIGGISMTGGDKNEEPSPQSAIEKPEKQDVAAIPEVPEDLKPEALEQKQAIKPAEPEPKPKPVAEKQKGIVLKMVKNSWVEIRDSNNRKLISRVLKEGDQYFVPERLGLSISIGNAGGVEIIVDGEPLQDLGVQGQVLRRIPLNAAALKARFPVKKQNSVETAGENE